MIRPRSWAGGWPNTSHRPAGLDVTVYTVSATQWQTVVPLLRIGNPDLVISDTRPTGDLS